MPETNKIIVLQHNFKVVEKDIIMGLTLHYLLSSLNPYRPYHINTK